MIKRERIILFVAGLFLLTSVACSNLLPERRSAAEPRREVPVSQESAQQAQQIITEAASGGTVRMSEAQFTSLIATHLAAGGDVPLTGITVWFDPGQITMQGELAKGVVPLLSGQLVTSGSLAAVNNQVVFQIESASIGGVSLPGTGREMLANQVNNALAGSNLGNRVRSITINEGEIIIEQE